MSKSDLGRRLVVFGSRRSRNGFFVSCGILLTTGTQDVLHGEGIWAGKLKTASCCQYHILRGGKKALCLSSFKTCFEKIYIELMKKTLVLSPLNTAFKMYFEKVYIECNGFKIVTNYLKILGSPFLYFLMILFTLSWTRPRTSRPRMPFFPASSCLRKPFHSFSDSFRSDRSIFPKIFCPFSLENGMNSGRLPSVIFLNCSRRSSTVYPLKMGRERGVCCSGIPFISIVS